MTHRKRISERRRSAESLATGLGWFSIGLGLAELVAGRSLAQGLGVPDRTPLVRTYGVREIATGVAILASRDPTPWIWGRVAGDALDLGTLSLGLGDDNPERPYVGLAMASVAAVTAVDVYCARELMAGAQEPPPPQIDYDTRSGLGRNARGAARDFQVPPDMRDPDAMFPKAWQQRDGRPGALRERVNA